MNSFPLLPLLVLAVPFLGALITLWAWRLRSVVVKNAITVAMSFATLVACAFLHRQVALLGGAVNVLGSEPGSHLHLPLGSFRPFSIVLHVDAYNVLIAFLACVVFFSTVCYTVRMTKGTHASENSPPLAFLMLFSILGMTFTDDLFTFGIFMNVGVLILAISLYRGQRRAAAFLDAFNYLLPAGLGCLFFQVGNALLYARYHQFNIAFLGSAFDFTALEMTAFGLFCASLLFQVGVWPLGAMNTRIFSMAKPMNASLLTLFSYAALFFFFRICFALYGEFLPQVKPFAYLLIVLGAGTVLSGLLRSAKQVEIGALLSGLAQVGLGATLFAFAIGLVTLDDPFAMTEYGFTSLRAGIHVAVNSVLALVMLVLISALLQEITDTNRVTQMGGLVRKMPQMGLIFFIGCASFAGLPPFGGYVSRLLLGESAFSLSPLLGIFVLFMVMMTGLVALKLCATIYLGPTPDRFMNVREAPFLHFLGIGLLFALLMTVTVAPGWFEEQFVNVAAESLVNRQDFIRLILGSKGGVP